MREIKFRCWNSHGKVMHAWPELVEKNKIHLLANQNPRYVIMQYTGLKDINGVDIYEGDVVEHFVIAWNSGGYGDWRRVVADIRSNFAEKPKVIGNIYENPELMEGE